MNITKEHTSSVALSAVSLRAADVLVPDATKTEYRTKMCGIPSKMLAKKKFSRVSFPVLISFFSSSLARDAGEGYKTQVSEYARALKYWSSKSLLSI